MTQKSPEDVDPVEKLLTTAKSDAVVDEFRVTGVMMQYYEICERELWFESRNIEIDRDNPNIVRGTHVDETAYAADRKNISITGMISPDLLQDGRVVEVKPSSSLEHGARLQLLYYLWYFERVLDVEKDGVLAHPEEREREVVTLTEEGVERVERAIRDIYAIIEADSPPPAEEKPYCEACAFHDFCWS